MVLLQSDKWEKFMKQLMVTIKHNLLHIMVIWPTMNPDCIIGQFLTPV